MTQRADPPLTEPQAVGSGRRMHKESLTALARHHLETARAAPSGRSAHPGDLLTIPDARHALEAVADSAVLLTVAVRA